MCLQDGCKRQPTYNVEGETKPLYCSQHKKNGMVDVKSKTCCQDGCKLLENRVKLKDLGCQ